MIEALSLELEAVKLESDLVSGTSLRTEPDAYREIPKVGIYFTPQEIRSQIILDAQAIEAEANRILKGSVSSYLSEQEMQDLSTIISDSKALSAYVQQFDLSPITGANTKVSDEHTAGHIALIRGGVEELEISVVSGEAGSVPVREPSEGTPGGGIGALLAIGVLVAVTVLIVESI